MPTTDDLPARLGAALTTLRPEPTTAILGVSGGADSVALACAWAELLRRGERTDNLAIAHFDHGLRPDSAADAAWVQRLAERLGLPCQCGVWNNRPERFSEAAARQARYRFLGMAAAACGAAVVVTAHTFDDQAETVLLAILRGAGLRGVGGMKSERPLPFAAAPTVRLLRPLLGARRSALRAFLAGLGQDWREDASNADPRFRRNRLRNDLLPRLRAEFNPRVEDALVRLSAQAAQAAGEVEARADDFLNRHCVGDRLPTAELLALPPALRTDVLRRLWERRGWPRGRMGAREWRRLAALVDRPDRGLQLPDGITVRKRRGLLQFQWEPKADAETPV